MFWAEDDAHAVAARLSGNGFDAAVVRAAFAGEDDDEDHPWAVTTNAPAVMLELLAEERDGWVDHDEPQHDAPVRIELPTAPRRHHHDPRAADGDASVGS